MSAVVFDGWCGEHTRYVCLFATSNDSRSSVGYKKILLGVLPMENEDSLSAVKYCDFPNFYFNVYGKKMKNFVNGYIIGDNVSVNEAFS